MGTFHLERSELEELGFRTSIVPAFPALPDAVVPREAIPANLVLSIPREAQLIGTAAIQNIDDLCAKLAGHSRIGEVFDSPELLVDIDPQAVGSRLSSELGSWECWVVEDGVPVTRIEAVAISGELSDEEAIARWCAGCRNFDILDSSTDGIVTFVRPGGSILDLAFAVRIDDVFYGALSVEFVNELGLLEQPDVVFDILGRNQELLRLIREIVTIS